MKETDAETIKAAQDISQKDQVFQKYNQLIHFGLRGSNPTKGKKSSKDLLTISFIKKYLHYAKTRITPVLTQEASDYIAAKYSELRTREDGAQDKYRVRSFFNVKMCCLQAKIVDHAHYSAYPGNADSFVHCTRKGSFERSRRNGNHLLF